MLNWIIAVSGAVSNLPSAPTKTVLGNAVSVGAWAMANAASMRTALRMRAVGFIGFLRNGQLYTDINRTRRSGEIAGECCFELSCLVKSLSQRFNDQSDQRIRSCIRKQNPIKLKRIRTHKRNWAS